MRDAWGRGAMEAGGFEPLQPSDIQASVWDASLQELNKACEAPDELYRRICNDKILRGAATRHHRDS